MKKQTCNQLIDKILINLKRIHKYYRFQLWFDCDIQDVIIIEIRNRSNVKQRYEAGVYNYEELLSLLDTLTYYTIPVDVKKRTQTGWATIG